VLVQLPVMLAAERHRELIAHFSPQRAGLGNFQVVRIAGAFLTNEAGLRGDKGKVRFATLANSPCEWGDQPGWRCLLFVLL